MPVLSITKVAKSYRNGSHSVSALEDISLCVAQGEMVALVGPSGSGKSTLLYSVAGLETIESGTIEIDGQAMEDRSLSKMDSLRREKIGFIFQDANLIPTLTAQENVEMALLNGKHSAKDRKVKTEQSLAEVGLKDRLHHSPRKLSGGQAQRVGIARALVSHPRLILADEPTANLDTEAATSVVKLLKDHVRNQACAALIATHDSRVSSQCDRIITLEDGRIKT